MPADFKKNSSSLQYKNKTGDTGDNNNYRPIALVTAESKCVEILEMYLITHDHQFGFKNMHSADMCMFSAKSVMKYYTEHDSPVSTCFLDPSKFFDRINHWTLFKKMIDSKMPLIIVRIKMFCYQSQLVCVKWGKVASNVFFVFPMVCSKVVYLTKNYLLFT